MFFRKKISFFIILLFQILLLTACSNKSPDRQDKVTEEPIKDSIESEEENTGEPLYVVLDIDNKKKLIKLKNIDTNRQESYHYTGGTYFLDKYADNLIISQIQRGEIVNIKFAGGSEKLSELKLSDQVIVYDNISEYSFDKKQNNLKIGKTEFYFDNNLVIFSGDKEIALSELGENDTINIREKDKRILSVMVTVGHGTVVFENTQLYEGGYVTIGNLLSEKLTQDMRLEVAEGTHRLSVLSDEREGVTRITVIRDEELTVDLSSMEQEIIKVCTLQFRITPSNAVVFLDDKRIDAFTSHSIPYGTHKVKVSAKGYETWEKKVKVSTANAALSIDLTAKPEEEQTPGQGTSS